MPKSKKLFVLVTMMMLLLVLVACAPGQSAQVNGTIKMDGTEVPFSAQIGAAAPTMNLTPAATVEPTATSTPITAIAVTPTVTTTTFTPTATAIFTPTATTAPMPNATNTTVPAATPIPTITTVEAPKPPTQPVRCPTDGEMQALFGFTARGIKPVNTSVKSEGEACKWTLQAVGSFVFEDVPFLEGWEFTVTLPDQSVVVFYGDGVSRDIMGGTFRFLDGYKPDNWVWNADDLLAHEFNFGFAQGRDPRYVTVNGNTPTDLWNGYDGSFCPVNAAQIAGLIGGEPSHWSQKGDTWTFKVPRDAGGNPIAYLILTAAQVEGATSVLNYWNGSKMAPMAEWDYLSVADAVYTCK